MRLSQKEEEGECAHACVGVLFSGGLDSTLLALLAGQLLAPRPLDLLNVAFQMQEGGFSTPIIQS
jgi:asparagine synthetase B (glutamine-hydrolysing)